VRSIRRTLLRQRSWRVLFALALCTAATLRADAAAAVSAPQKTDRARVKVARVGDGYLTVHSDQGTPLRGGTAFVYKSGRKTGKTAYVSQPAYYRTMRASGLNAVRLIAFDPYQKTRGHDHADLEDTKDVTELLADIDKVVDLASAAGMYVVVNYHDVGGYEKQYLTKFWDLVGPRYRDRTHVLYELMNEPVKWFPEHYTQQHLSDVQALYDRVRKSAPNSHLVLLTFANTASYDPNASMRTVAERLGRTGAGIKWDNASVGFHTYQTKKTSRPIADLVRHFPGVNTEQNLPNNEGCVPMDGDEFGVQTMERLGLSWFHWHTHGPERFGKNYLGRVLPDAKAKGYLWKFDATEQKERAGGTAAR
jgi:hypothetical protein